MTERSRSDRIDWSWLEGTFWYVLPTDLPEGRVHLTFVPDAARSSRSATIGIGRAVQHEGAWSLEMQMSTGTGIAHWATMMRTRPGDLSWTSLPGVGISVPEMLEGCEPPRLIETP